MFDFQVYPKCCYRAFHKKIVQNDLKIAFHISEEIHNV